MPPLKCARARWFEDSEPGTVPPRSTPPVTFEEFKAAAAEYRAREDLRKEEEKERAKEKLAAWRRAHRTQRTRKPSIASMIAQAEKSGRTVSSVTTPDGTTIHFGETKPTEDTNPWLADIEKATKQ